MLGSLLVSSHIQINVAVYLRLAHASMAEWLRAWDTLATMKLWRREVVSSIPDRGTIVG